MVNWTVTATTIYCGSIDEEVTIMVFKDGSTRCTGYQKRVKPFPQKRQVKCDGASCDQIIQYKNRLFTEEAQGK